MNLILRVLVNALALGAAAYFVPGIRAGSVTSVLLIALVFGVLNALVRPFLKLLSCPLLVLTLGLFTLVLNAMMLMLTAWRPSCWSSPSRCCSPCICAAPSR